MTMAGESMVAPGGWLWRRKESPRLTCDAQGFRAIPSVTQAFCAAHAPMLPCPHNCYLALGIISLTFLLLSPLPLLPRPLFSSSLPSPPLFLLFFPRQGFSV